MGKEKQFKITYVCQSFNKPDSEKEAALFELDKVTRYIWGHLAPDSVKELISSASESQPAAE